MSGMAIRVTCRIDRFLLVPEVNYKNLNSVLKWETLKWGRKCQIQHLYTLPLPFPNAFELTIFPLVSVLVWVYDRFIIFTPQPSGLEGYCRHGPGGRAGGRAGGCQTCGTHISVTSWWIFSIRSSVDLSRPVVVHCHGHLPICPIWACPWAKNLSNLAQIGSRLCGTHISETVGWIDPI